MWHGAAEPLREFANHTCSDLAGMTMESGWFREAGPPAIEGASMSETSDRREDADRVAAAAPAEGAENPGGDAESTTPHPQTPAEGADPDESGE